MVWEVTEWSHPNKQTPSLTYKFQFSCRLDDCHGWTPNAFENLKSLILLIQLMQKSLGAKESSVLSIKEGCLFGLFCLSCWDLPIHGAYCCTLGIIGKPLMSRGAPNWFHKFSTYTGVVIEYWRWWKKLHQFDQVSKNGLLLSCCGLFLLQYWVYYFSKLPVCDVESFRSCKNSKTWTTSQPMVDTSTISFKMWIRKIYWTLTLSTATQLWKVWQILRWSGEKKNCKISIFSKYSNFVC